MTRNRPEIVLGGVEHVHEQSRPLEMRQELVAETGTFLGPFDPAQGLDHELSLVRDLDGPEEQGPIVVNG